HHSLHLNTICCVSFSYQTILCGFVGCVLEIRPQSTGECRLVLSAPTDMAATNRRQSFRVPVLDETGLKVTIQKNNEAEFEVTPVNISDGGLQFDFDEDNRNRLSVGQFVSVELTYEGEIVRNVAEVCRLSGTRCALHFATPPDDE